MNTHQQPTYTRYLVVAVATLMSLLLYMDRFCLSIAELYIKEDLGLTDTQVGWMLSAFFWTYALGQVPAGWLTDRFGSRVMLTLYILLWSLFTGLTGAAGSFIALLLLRFGFGFSQAGAYPTAASMVSKWVPFGARGTASGIIAVGGRAGLSLATVATGYMLIVLTPMSTPATLKQSDLLHGQRFCYELSTPDKDAAREQLRKKIVGALDRHTTPDVEEQAAEYSKSLATAREALIKQGSDPDDAIVPPTLLPKYAPEAITADLSRIIRNSTFFTPEEIASIKMESEGKRLAAIPVDQRTRQQSERLNRFVLEGLYPRSIKKLYGTGWRWMMGVYGSLGIIVAALVWWLCRTTPARHPWCNEAERKLIVRDQPMKTEGRVENVPWIPLLASVSMWLCCATQWFTNIGWMFLTTWAPRYLADVHELGIEQRGLYLMIPPLFGWLGMLSGGFFTDRATQWFGLRWGRAIPIGGSRFLAMGAYLICLLQPTPIIVIALFCVVSFATGLGTPSIWAYNQDVGGKYVGSVLGWGNMWGNLGAAVTPPLLIWIIGPGMNWNYAFVACAAAFFLAGLAGLGINANEPIDRPHSVPQDVD